MKKLDLFYQFNPNIQEKNPLKALDFEINTKSFKNQPSRDIMEDIKLLKRAADYMNTSFHQLYNQTKTAIDYYTGENGFYDFQDFISEKAQNTYDAEYLERVIEEWYMNEELRFLELGPEGYEAYYNPPEIEEDPLPYTFESLLWDLYMLWFEIWLACELYLLARPELKEIEDSIIQVLAYYIVKFQDRNKPSKTQLFMSQLENLAKEYNLDVEQTQEFFNQPSNIQVLYNTTKNVIKNIWLKIVDIINN